MHVVLALGCLLLLPTLVTAETPAVAQAPNVVIILADDMGYGDVSCNNPNSRIQTPHIDRIAKAGMRFTDAHAGGSYCIPSRYALMTGRFAVRKTMSLAEGPLIEEGRMTVASLLRDHGYATAMIGKWHLGFDPYLQNEMMPADYSQPLRGGPADRGFHSFFGMHASLDLPPYFFIRDRRAVMAPTENVGANTSVGGPEGWNDIQGAFWRAGKISADFKFDEVTPRFIDEAVSVIRRHGADNRGRPLFLYLALPSPHTPWLPQDEFRGKSGAGLYGDFVLQVDAGIGRVLDALKAAGIEDDTLLLFTSDNGPVWYDKDRERFGHDSAGGLRGMKFSSYEGGHRMPFLVRWPRRIAAGHVCRQTIAFSDVFATLAELVKARSLPEATAEDSVSFLPYLLDAELPPAKRPPIVHDAFTIRDGDWKLILPKQRNRSSEPASAELYDLKTDQAEQSNVIAQHPDIAERLRRELAKWRN